MKNVRKTVFEVTCAVIPITILVIILQALLRLPIENLAQFLVGSIMVTIGLTLFLLGNHLGILPIGETIGAALPKTGKLWIVVLFGFLLGFVVTMAEPNIRVLATQVDFVSGGIISKNILIYTVGLGVAIFIGLAMLRIIIGIPIKHLIIASYGLVLILAAITPAKFIPVSLDAGGVTTGPMLIPFILALGVGVASVLRGKRSSTDGFGLAALAFIGPVLAVLLLGVIYG